MTIAKQKVPQTCKTQQIKEGTTEKVDDKLSGNNDGGFIVIGPTFVKLMSKRKIRRAKLC
jgi:hypothetical protein